MEPQLPPAPSPAYHHPHALHRAPVDIGYQYSEKDVYDHRQQYAPRLERGSKGSSNSRAHDSVISYPRSPNAATPSPPSPVSSLLSARNHRSQQSARHSQDAISAVSQPSRAHVDPEKADSSPHRSPSPAHLSASNPDVTRQTIAYDPGEYDEKGPEDKPVQLLLYLSLPCALLSFLIMLWTMVALLISLLLQPFRLFSSRSALPTHLTTFLAPPLNLQLHLVYSFSASEHYSAPMLVVIHLLSPFIAVGVAIAAWTAACFWFFSAILGDPAGQDGHNDGKESILGVRNWWDRWLSRALR
ncbi:uncharacterized protein N0V89_003921 [Didymosphaeria variabile]|uniref:Uncharacterized protein n=1 Tax=Didymosphaeria variabile TaxID=1932322 RepID=A0A9W8XQV1_9PLEO|nr:uncharacterized protein N0V89_003921 [Didymosphaeria variabile]KAJ4355896.1 hypothetical protein N0V89_003921 [Didymosphaeria variabile]